MGEIVLNIVLFLVRIFCSIFLELFLEILIKGPGYFIASMWRDDEKLVPNGFRVVMAGVIFWALIGGAGYLLYTNFVAANR